MLEPRTPQEQTSSSRLHGELCFGGQDLSAFSLVHTRHETLRLRAKFAGRSKFTVYYSTLAMRTPPQEKSYSGFYSMASLSGVGDQGLGGKGGNAQLVPF